MALPDRKAVLWWIRRDLRLADAPALSAACARGGTIVPVFVLDPALRQDRLHRASCRRSDFLFAGLRALDAALRAQGSRLIVRDGSPTDALARLVEETSARAIVAEGDVSPYARRRDAAVRRALPLELVDGPMVFHPTAVTKADGSPYTVFTPFKRAWLAKALPEGADLLPPPGRLPPVPDTITTLPVPDGGVSPDFPAGEFEALRRLGAFTDGQGAPIHGYHRDRDRVDTPGTSSLAPYLRFGMVSARAAVVAARRAGVDPAAPSGPSTWLSELIWREFYLTILFHHPHVLREAFNAALRAVPWRDAPEDLAAWEAGRTGYPIVDAAMHQLAATGWMHNRARMIVASFLTKDLLIDWRAGEAWFMRQLIDGDPAANNGGWQWTAGVGTDAAPYFRIFNPTLQARKFDPDGTYVKRWLPVLARVPVARVHEPWTLSPLEQHASGCVVGRDYPEPIVDHGMARVRALAAYGQASSARR